MDARRRTAVLIGVGLFLFSPGPLNASPAGAAPARTGPGAEPPFPVTTTAAPVDPDVPAAVPEAPVAAPEIPAVEPEVGVVGARRKPRSSVPSPPSPQVVDHPDLSPPPPPPPAAPPPPEPVLPEPLPTPPATAPEVVPMPPPPVRVPSERAPAGEPRQAPRLPTTGNGLEGRIAAFAGACLSLGGVLIAGGARRRDQRPLPRS